MTTTTALSASAAATLETLLTNAARVGKESHHVALASALLSSLDGVRVASACVWCAEKDPASWLPGAIVRRLPRGGECYSCGYAGPDCLVVAS